MCFSFFSCKKSISHFTFLHLSILLGKYPEMHKHVFRVVNMQINKKEKTMLSEIRQSICTGMTDAYNAVSLPSAQQLVRNVQTIAVPAVFIYAAANMPAADAGPIAWAACIAICEAAAVAATAATGGAAAGSLIACVNACAPLLYLPYPP